MVMGSEGTRRHSPTVMTGEGKEETDNAMRVMLQRGAHMLVTNPGIGAGSKSEARAISRPAVGLGGEMCHLMRR